MRESVAVCAILGAIIEAVAAIGGPRLAGVGMLTDQRPPPMATGPLVVGLVVAAVSFVGGVLVTLGRSGQLWGAALLAAAVAGILVVGPWTGWFTMGAAFTVLAGALALFVRDPRRPRA